MTSAKRGDGLELHFAYDGLGRRISKRVKQRSGDSAVTWFYWDGEEIVHEVRVLRAGGKTSTEERTHVPDPNGAATFAQSAWAGPGDSKTWELVIDGPNRQPTSLLSELGSLTKVDIDVWGSATTGATHTPVRYRGQYFDEETGLSCNGYRYYDPTLGRYMSPDPLRLQATLEAYTYVENMPLSLVDPTGLQATTIIRDRSGRELGRGEHEPGRDPDDLHPAVRRALPPTPAHTAGANPPGRSPATCGEPAALSDHLRRFERRTGRSCDPDTAEGRAALGDALDEINPNRGITTRSRGDENELPNGSVMAPCANCSQTIPELHRLAGRTTPPNIITPGWNPARSERRPFTPPQVATAPRLPYETRLAAYPGRVVHERDPNTGVWTSRPPNP
jgi:RHS repeat-associated protein